MKQLRVSLTIDEVKSLITAAKNQIESFEKGLKTHPQGDFVRSIVEDEMVSLKKTELYLTDIVSAAEKEERKNAKD